MVAVIRSVRLTARAMLQDTYRYHGHSISDPGSSYRTRDEVQGVRRARDPIEHVRKLIVDHEVAQTDELKKLEKAIKKEVRASTYLSQPEGPTYIQLLHIPAAAWQSEHACLISSDMIGVVASSVSLPCRGCNVKFCGPLPAGRWAREGGQR